MTTRSRLLVVFMALILATSLIGPAALAVDDGSDDEYVTDIGTSHDLDSADAVSEFNDRGQTQADISRLDMSVTIAEKKSDVGIEDKILPANQVNDYLRLEYNEEAERTIRILIPGDYWTPYHQEGVDSVTSDHEADYMPARGGEYTAVVITLDGPADVVLPVKWYDSMSYRAIERVDDRLNNSVGLTLRDDGSQWEYVESDDLISGPGYEIGEDSDDLTVQYDATSDGPEETWVNAPQGESMNDNIYYYTRDAENSTSYVVSETSDPPTVRYKHDSSFTDRLRGDFNDITMIPDRIRGLLGGGFLG